MLLMSHLTVPASPLTRLVRQAAFRPGLPTRRSTTFRPTVRDRAKHLILDGVACALVGAQLPVVPNGGEGRDRARRRRRCGPDRLGEHLPPALRRRQCSTPVSSKASSSMTTTRSRPFIAIPSCCRRCSAPPIRPNPFPGRAFCWARSWAMKPGRGSGKRSAAWTCLSRGWHSGVVFGTLSAAAAAGTIYGLNAAGFEDAMGMAATQSCGLMSAQFESMVKRMQHGFASRNGLTAAALAAGGYTGIKRVFERRYGGYLATFGQGHPTDASRHLRGSRLVVGDPAHRRESLCRDGSSARRNRRRVEVACYGRGSHRSDRAHRYRHARSRLQPWWMASDTATDDNRRANERRLRGRRGTARRVSAHRPIQRSTHQ